MSRSIRHQGLLQTASRGSAAVVCLGITFPVAALASSLLNGDFASGDLTGWTATAIDASGNPVAPSIAVVPLASQFGVQFSAGTFGSSPFISTLSQSFLVNASEPLLEFSFQPPSLSPDAGGGGGQFLDTLTVSVFDGTQTYALLLEDSTGQRADPFGTAPGPVSVGPANTPFTYMLAADLTPFIGSSLTLNVDVMSNADGAMTVFNLGEFGTDSPLLNKSVIPEAPAPVLLIGAGMALAAYGRNRRRSRSRG